MRRLAAFGGALAGATLIITMGCGKPPTDVTTGSVKSVGGLTAARVAATTVGNTASFSSSKVNVSWAAPSGVAAISYIVGWEDGATHARATTSTTATTIQLTDLQSATLYLIDVSACTADPCSASTARAATSITTPAEVWQLQGTGASTSGLTKLVFDGNVRIHVARYGTDAPAGLSGRLLMYYGPQSTTYRGFIPATTATAASAAAPSSYLAFTSTVGASGLLNPPSAAPGALIKQINTGQVVPLAAALGGKARVYFEATGADGLTRIVSLDAQDGYAALDLNRGAAALCGSAADYAIGGGCAPTVEIAVASDATNGNPKIVNARQFKIGYPTQTDWRWNGAIGTYMMFTVDAIAGCTTAFANQGYAVWDGMRWIVQYESAGGCPKTFKSAQAMHPVHLGGARYKAYYGNVSDQAGRISGSALPFLGPKLVIYGDGALTGDPSRVDFEDWEAAGASGHAITFLWPNGTPLSSTAAGYIDDFSVVTPTADLRLQVFYLAITDGTVSPFTAAAVLINP